MKLKLLLLLFSILSFALAGCGAISLNTPPPLPTVVLGGPNQATPRPASDSESSSGGVSASGNVVPAQQASLAAALSGTIKTVAVSAGSGVTAGQVLVTLSGAEQLAAAVEAANLAVLTAQQSITNLQNNAASATAAAQQALANAEKALEDAQTARYQKNLARVTQATIDQAQADLIIAKNSLKDAQDNYDKYAGRPADDLQRAQAFSRLAAAQQKVDQEQWNLDYLLSKPDANEVDQADAAIAVAKANLAAAQQKYDRLKNGPDPDALALTQATLKNAQAQQASAQAALANLEIKAPFAGVISQVNVHAGEAVLPGAPLLVLADTAHLQVQTTDLSERDVPRVSVGQKVSVNVKALNQTLSGKVSAIAPLASTLGGDVVYQTTIVLDTVPPALRAGMSVDVTYGK
jgi:HlyD family secretion protein